LFINIHCHQIPGANEKAIQNKYNNFHEVGNPGNYSIGLHPWYVHPDSWKLEMISLKKWCAHKNVIAIGECGLDKVCTTDFPLQQEVFIEQIQFANEIRKPLILHCVRAYEELLHLLDGRLVKVPVIFHGFAKQSLPLAKKIISRGHFLSFGKTLQSSNMRSMLQLLPVEQIFLETDDDELSIEAVYNLAATAFSIPLESLSLQIQKNAAKVFGKTNFPV
jgi:TatD DNase family protein